MNSAWVNPKRWLFKMTPLLKIRACVCADGGFFNGRRAQDMRVPEAVTAGENASVATSGSGKATFYLIGPGVSRKSDVTLGEEIRLDSQDVRTAGHYTAILCSDTCHSANFYVNAAEPASFTFLVHPSRVPVALTDAVSGVALPFDQYHNLVLSPLNVDFKLTAERCFPMVASCPHTKRRRLVPDCVR